MKKTLLVLVALSLTIGITNAQTPENKWGVGFMDGINQYKGDLGNGMFNYSKAWRQNVTGSVNRYIDSSFNVSLQGSYGDYGYATSSKNFDGRKFNATVLLSYKFNNGYLLKADAKLAPFIMIGVGADYIHSGVTSRDYDVMTQANIYTFVPSAHKVSFSIPIGAGLSYKINDKLSLQYQALYCFTNRETKLVGAKTGTKDSYIQQGIGIVFNFDCHHVASTTCNQ